MNDFSTSAGWLYYGSDPHREYDPAAAAIANAHIAFQDNPSLYAELFDDIENELYIANLFFDQARADGHCKEGNKYRHVVAKKIHDVSDMILQKAEQERARQQAIKKPQECSLGALLNRFLG